VYGKTGHYRRGEDKEGGGNDSEEITEDGRHVVNDLIKNYYMCSFVQT